MVGYVVEYVKWYLERGEDWNTWPEYNMFSSLTAAEAFAQGVRWDKDVIEESVHIRLMTETEYDTYTGKLV